MKFVVASSLAVALFCSVAPAAHAQSGGSVSSFQVYSAMAHAGVRHSHVFVLTRGGDVTLTGWVDDFNQVPLAGAAAAAVPGVTSVTNWVTRGR